MNLPALLRRACPRCGVPVGPLGDICEGCEEHLPTGLRWALRDARDGRWRDRITYRVVRDVARKHLARNSKRPDAATQTNAKEA